MIGFVACDVIEEPFLKENNEVSEHLQLSDDEISNWVNAKHVLLEDYTGVRCVNCPAAGEIALDLQERYDHKVIVLGVHAGDLANFPPFDLRTPEGADWWKELRLQQNPQGTINRKMVNGGYTFDASEWENAVSEEMTKEPEKIRLLAAVDYNEETRELKVSAYSKFLADFPDTYSLTVCVMEDNIVGVQQTENGIVENYVHRHVFRTTMNGSWGVDLNTEPIASEEEIVKTYTKKLDAAYNADNCYIIAYVSNSETKEILQVIEKKIK